MYRGLFKNFSFKSLAIMYAFLEIVCLPVAFLKLHSLWPRLLCILFGPAVIIIALALYFIAIPGVLLLLSTVVFGTGAVFELLFEKIGCLFHRKK